MLDKDTIEMQKYNDREKLRWFSRFMAIGVMIVFLMLFAKISYGQDKAQINSWRGLTLDETTVEQAVEKLGAAHKDKPNESFRPVFYSTWFGRKLLKMRRLTFKNLEGFDEANLFFVDDKLVVIELDTKKDILPSTLIGGYEEKFFPLVGNYGKGISPDDLARADREIIYPDRFPLVYNLGAANDRSIALASASAGFGESLAGAMMAPPGARATAVSAAMPGLVRKIQLISRTLEDRKGVDLLK